MQDTIITGAGNSRTLKTVADFLTRYPTYADFAAGFIAGEIPADIGPLVAAGVQQQGMALNKANLLSDATGAKLGLANTATPNDALSALASHYGTCATAAAAAAKVVTLPGFSLATGTAIAVKFTYGNTASSPTLNVNGTGAKSIAVYGSTAAGSGAWSAGEVVLFVYDGTRWVMNSGAILGTGYGIEIYMGTFAGTGEMSFSLTFPKLPIYIMFQTTYMSGAQKGNAATVHLGIVGDGRKMNPGRAEATMSISGKTITFTGKSSSPTANIDTYTYVAIATTNEAKVPSVSY